MDSWNTDKINGHQLSNSEAAFFEQYEVAEWRKL